MNAPATNLYCSDCTCKSLGRSSCYEKFWHAARQLAQTWQPGAWIGVDLDGTLARDIPPPYPKVGPPLPKMVARVRAWIANGIEVRIVTARLSPERHDFGDTAEEQREIVQAWLLINVGVQLKVQAYKDGFMQLLYDDRAVRVERNTGELALTPRLARELLP